ncbi:helix-turn-helix transcriptional regulator [Actinomadura harenae]|uniref:DNA-binding response regulator n=1 Tax=Actinomadura harenae TaxID=2483351 RepID=A0A3M2LS56_9ACTN|nr:response regulator transcription factor [Actinomadura harenae]RMI38935.1 DNA-binding response regulator [Actinomadura harenae]
MTLTMPGIPVVVHAPDPITLAGVTSGLRGRTELRLVDDADAEVAVVVADTLDESTRGALRRYSRVARTRTVLVAAHLKEAQLLDAVEAGVVAILWRHEASADTLTRAVLAAARGGADLPPDLLGRLLKQVGRIQRGSAQAPGGGPIGLAQRELDVLGLVADGMDTAEIAAKLSYSERTVKNVLHGIMSRLHLRNRAHAVAYAIREGYI